MDRTGTISAGVGIGTALTGHRSLEPLQPLHPLQNPWELSRRHAHLRGEREPSWCNEQSGLHDHARRPQTGQQSGHEPHAGVFRDDAELCRQFLGMIE